MHVETFLEDLVEAHVEDLLDVEKSEPGELLEQSGLNFPSSRTLQEVFPSTSWDLHSTFELLTPGNVDTLQLPFFVFVKSKVFS